MARVADARYLDGVMASKTKNKGAAAAAAKKAGKSTKKAGAKATDKVAGKSGRAAKAHAPRIADPAQQVLARHIPRLCAIFGFPQAHLTVRGASKTPTEYVQNSMREVALGAVVWLGRELGLHWSGLHNRQSKAERGRTEIPELQDAHRFSLGLFATRFGALSGLGDDPETGAPLPAPVGQVGAFVRQAYELVRADAVRELGAMVPL